MCRDTKDSAWKARADHIPYRDFNAPDIPHAPRHASAAAITAAYYLPIGCYLLIFLFGARLYKVKKRE